MYITPRFGNMNAIYLYEITIIFYPMIWQVIIYVFKKLDEGTMKIRCDILKEKIIGNR